VELKRLKEILSQETHSLADIIEITSENFISNSRHNKEIKQSLELILEQLSSLSTRLSALESKQSSIFQIEIDDSDDSNKPHESSLEEELENMDDD
jgi:hypothetical protein